MHGDGGSRVHPGGGGGPARGADPAGLRIGARQDQRSAAAPHHRRGLTELHNGGGPAIYHRSAAVQMPADGLEEVRMLDDGAPPTSARLRIRALEAELARAYVNLADAASLCGMMNQGPELRQLGDDAGAEASLLLADGPNATCHCNCTEPDADGAFMPPFSNEWWTYCGASLGCITVAALA